MTTQGTRMVQGAVPTGTPTLDMAQVDPNEARALFHKIRVRLLPLLMVIYLLHFLDRLNVGFTQLQMKTALGITDAQFGVVAGLVFVSYTCMQTPANLFTQRVGLRKMLLTAMVLWGLTSAATVFVHTANQYYLERFLLGIMESPFFPGIILYLSYWLPSQERGKAIGVFMVSAQVCGVIGGPVSGWVMTHLNGVAGLAGWQWCFLMEGLPCVILGVISFYYFSDSPEHAKWLSAREKAIIAASLEAERRAEDQHRASQGKWRRALTDPRVYLLGFLIATSQGSGMVLNFWLPTIIHELGVKSIANVGYLVVIPFLAGSLGCILLPLSSDRRGERRWHYALAVIIAAAMYAVWPQVDWSLSMSLAVLAIAAFCINGSIPTFWTIPARYLGKEAAAAGIGVIATLGQFGNLFSPMIIGFLKTRTGTMNSGMYVHASAMVLAAIVMLTLIPTSALRVGVAPKVAEKNTQPA